MNRKGYVEFLKKKKKSERTVVAYTGFFQRYEKYLLEHKKGKKIENAGKKDLHDFEKWGEKNIAHINRHLWSIKEYYEFISKRALSLEANAMLGERYFCNFKLKEFVGVKQSHVMKLAKAGIKTAKDMLHAGLNDKLRKELSQNTGIPHEDILEIVKLSDQARIPGHKKVRARLYHDAGFDTIDKMAACDIKEIRMRLADFIKKTGFKGIPPTPGEAKNTITMANYIRRIVQY